MDTHLTKLDRYRSPGLPPIGQALPPLLLLLVLFAAGCGSTSATEPQPRTPPTPEPPVTQTMAALAFVAEPGRAEGQVPFAQALEVEARDASGKRVATWGGSVTIALKKNPGTSTLGGTLTRAAVNGVARFNDLTLDRPGTGYTLRASSDAFEVESAPFDVGLTIAQVSAGLEFTCALTRAGKGYCWGSNSYGALGTGDAGTGATSPVPVAGGLTFSMLEAGNRHVCAVSTVKKAYCWGAGADGQLGSGATSHSNIPMEVAGNLAFEMVSGGSFHSCGVTTEGKAYCWGAGDAGKLGNNAKTQQFIPVAVSSSLTFKTVSAGNQSTCGLSTAGASYCWGSNWLGQIGNSAAALENPAPIVTSGGRVFADLSAGSAHTCGVTTSGAAYCWGYATPGTLGTGDGGPPGTAVYGVLTPKAVAGDLSFKQVSAASDHSCGVTTAGKGFCWGYGTDGRLGHGSTTQSLVPVSVWGELTFASVSAGYAHSCAVTPAGEAYCWGKGGSGELGHGSTTGSVVPVLVSGTKH